jgi:hypothetical protein
LFCQLNGLDPDKAVYYDVESPFHWKQTYILYANW